ncbi:MAG TPA: N-acetylneuraminate synthase [Ignavibacteriales bacterium]|nr:N-acetylneuraminate synthase [Ignavibacteriales bacterium]
MKTFIIAEAGVNHNGDIETAFKLVDAAVEAKADAVKFQIFKTENLTTNNAPKATYQKQTTASNETQAQMLKKLELSYDNFEKLNNYCKAKNILFLASPFDIESLHFLLSLSPDYIKIASGEIQNLPMLKIIAGKNKKIIMSTGMATIDEIQNTVDYLINNGTKKQNISILHCNTQYPTPYNDVNLLAIKQLKRIFKTKVGYSDHTIGIEIPIAAVAIGATIIEKHFTLNRLMEGPDHKTSIEPNELKKMVSSIRNVELALGNKYKIVTKSELDNINIVRKSIVAARDIKKDEIFTENNITLKRPGTGLSPMLWDKVIGTKAKKNFYKDDFIEI